MFYVVDFGVPEPFISSRCTHFVEQNICCIYVMDTFQMEYSEPWFFGAFMCYVKVLFYVHVNFRPPMSNSYSVVKNCRGAEQASEPEQQVSWFCC